MRFVENHIYIDTRNKHLLIFDKYIESIDVYFFYDIDDDKTYIIFPIEKDNIIEF